MFTAHQNCTQLFTYVNNWDERAAPVKGGWICGADEYLPLAGAAGGGGDWTATTGLIRRAPTENGSGRQQRKLARFSHDNHGRLVSHVCNVSHVSYFNNISHVKHVSHISYPILDTRISSIHPFVHNAQGTPPEIWNGLDWTALVESRPPNIGKLRG